MQHMKTPLSKEIVDKYKRELGIKDVGKASIRELVKIVNDIEAETGQKFVRMEMGVPGLDPVSIGVEAEKEALDKGVASKYPMMEGVPEFKNEASRFVKGFLNIDVHAENCIPSVGSMQGTYATFMVSCRRDASKDTTLFIDAGVQGQKQQMQDMGLKYESFDVYNVRGDKLRAKLEGYLQDGKISTIIYSNPNNPSWICFTEHELQIIGELAEKYDVMVMEDLAYFGMDFREDYSQPGIPPFQPTVARYTDNFVLLISTTNRVYTCY